MEKTNLFYFSERLSSISSLTDQKEQRAIIYTFDWKSLITKLDEIATNQVIVYVEQGLKAMLICPDYLRIALQVNLWVVKKNDSKLAELLRLNYLVVSEIESPALLLEKYKKEILRKIEVSTKKSFFHPIKKIDKKSILRKPRFSFFKKAKPSVHLEFNFVKGPYGGGNQFLKGLQKQMKKKDWLVEHQLKSNIVLFNSFQFDENHLNKFKEKRAVHRVDGPVILVRGADQHLDDKLFKANNEVADITIFQTFWSMCAALELGYCPINPVVIINAVDQHIFNKKGKLPFSSTRKTKIISTSWSNNPRKGGPIYKWLDQNLDFNKYEYTFVGRVSEKLENIKIIPPVPSNELAEILKKQDIYITASAKDPCSNALIEALSSGLPALYLNSGGNPEIVKKGGLPFSEKEQIPELLKRIIENYTEFQDKIEVVSMEEIAKKYIACLTL